MSISLISSVLWVPRGASAQHPRKFDLSDPAEFERIERLGKIKLEDARRELEELEKGVDGMQVDAEDDNVDGDGDEWESDRQSGSGSDSGSDSDPEAKARKMADKIKKGAAGKDNQEEDEMAQYNLDTYDDNEAAQSSNMGIFSNIKGLSYYNSNDASQDPYITLENPGNEDATLEKEELEILPTDNLLVSAKTQDEVNMLEIHVWEGPDDGEDDNDEETAEGNLYVHHDTLLPAMPLCMEWGDCRPSTSRQGYASSTSETGAASNTSERGSFIAVGTLEKTIEVWDLDVVEGMFPEAILGDLTEEEIKEEEEKLRQEEQQSAAAETSASAGGAAAAAGDGDMALDGSGAKKKDKKKKKKKQKPALASGPDGTAPSVVLPYAHTDSILSLSWNRVHRSLLASASADSSIKLWDLSSPTCQRALRSFTLHGDSKVQSIQWSPTDPTVLLSGAWGGSMRIFDTRAPASALSAQLPSAAAGVRGSKKINPDVEVLHWDPFATAAGGAGFYAATGNGQVVYYDARSLEKPLWTLDAHDGPCAALDVNETINGCIVTGGTDKQTKVWNVQQNAATGGQGISLVLSKDFGVGKVFTTLFSPDDPTTVALAGSAARLQVWDAFTNTGFRRVFGDRLRSALGASGDGAKSRSFAENSRRARGNGLVSTAPEEAGEEESDDE